MPAPFRLATTGDAPALAHLAATVWPEEHFAAAQIAGALADPTHRSIIAVTDTCFIGFVDCFAVYEGNGVRRWEIDLLAVSPAHRGKGIGRSLVKAATDAGNDAGIPHARTVVAVGNTASERAFAACGFAPVSAPCAICATDRIGTRERAFAATRRCIRVVTFGYTGWWLEESYGDSPADDASSAGSIADGDRTGILVPTASADAIERAAIAGFEAVGTYQIWTR